MHHNYCTDLWFHPFGYEVSPAGSNSISSFVEVSTPEKVLKVDITDIHGQVVGDAWFGSLTWSYDERYVAYVAHPKAEKKVSSFDASVSNKPNKFEYRESWGEKMTNINTLVICLLDTQSGRVSVLTDLSEVLSVETEVTIGSPSFSPVNYDLVFTCWHAIPKRLGMIYCYQRPCSLYIVDLADYINKLALGGMPMRLEPKLASPGLALARQGRISPDGKTLVFIGRQDALASHNGCFELYKMRLDSLSSEPVKILGIVTNPVGDLPKDLPHADLIALVRGLNAEVFPGVFTDKLPANCFSNDGSKVYFDTQWGLSVTPVSVDLETSEVKRLIATTSIVSPVGSICSDASVSILDINCDLMLFAASTPVMPARLGMLDLSSGQMWRVITPPRLHSVASKFQFKHLNAVEDNSEATFAEEQKGTEHSIDSNPEIVDVLHSLGTMKWRVLDIVDQISGVPYQALLVLPPKPLGSRKVPLVVSPHGGPHSSYSTSFIASTVYMCLKLNAGVLLVNYRGSTGYGQKSIDSLLGNIGLHDVNDCMKAIDIALTMEPKILDKSCIYVVGGSHGGFLTGHLIGQFPNTFVAAAMRNPVTNIPAMVSVTDIPDWCHIEACGEGSYDFKRFFQGGPTIEALQKMQMVSPIAYVKDVVAPTLILLGKLTNTISV